MIKKRLAFVVLLSLATEACVSSYSSKLGYRARQAVLQNDVAAFDELMAEAAVTPPAFASDDPPRTVLSHFVDLGKSDRYFPMIEAWRAKGWVNDNMTCAIHRGRYRGVAATDPAEAARSAGVCIDRARAAAEDPDRRWEVEACLERAPFLSETSTAAIAPYIERAADTTEPYLFRAALLEALTTQFLQDAAILRMNDPSMPVETAKAKARAQLDLVSARFDVILDRVKHDPDLALIAGATAFGAIELERVHVIHGESLIGRYATSELPADNELAWSWVRAMKSRKKIPRVEALGLWDRKREPAYDAFWYLCTGGPRPTSLYTKERVADPESLRRERCADRPTITGPFPLEATARASSRKTVHNGAIVD